MSADEIEKIAPVIGYTPGIPWALHLEAYDAYCKRYGPQQALIEGGCRGGFGTEELDDFIPGWREKVSEFTKLKAELVDLRAALAAKTEDQQSTDLMAQCMSMVRSELIEAGIIDKTVPPMMVSDAVCAHIQRLAKAVPAVKQGGEA